MVPVAFRNAGGGITDRPDPGTVLFRNGSMLASHPRYGGQFSFHQSRNDSAIDAGDSPMALFAVLQARYSPDETLSELSPSHASTAERHDLR